MALPLLNDSPKYEMKIPSTGKKVKYRPYLVKEEKILLLASESKDINQITNAVLDTVVACVDGNVSRSQLTTFDVEYMFLQLRSKSVGENIELKINCDECKHQNDHTVNLDKITCDVPKKTNIIQISDTVSVEMRYPSYDMLDFDEIESMENSAIEIMSRCMVAVISNDERVDLSEETDESISNFIGSMTQSQFEKVAGFLQDMPAVRHKIDFTCESCGHSNEIVLEGMQSFF